MKPLAALQDMHFTNNIFYFVMEFASGGTLVDYVHKQVGGWPDLSAALLFQSTLQELPSQWASDQEARRPVLHAGGGTGLSLVAAVPSCKRRAVSEGVTSVICLHSECCHSEA